MLVHSQLLWCNQSPQAVNPEQAPEQPTRMSESDTGSSSEDNESLSANDSGTSSSNSASETTETSGEEGRVSTSSVRNVDEHDDRGERWLEANGHLTEDDDNEHDHANADQVMDAGADPKNTKII